MGSSPSALLQGCYVPAEYASLKATHAEVANTNSWSSPFGEARQTSLPTVVLVGGTGVGKSNLGNYLLGRSAFRSENAQESVTTEATVIDGTWFGGLSPLRVIDCPGIGDTKGGNADQRQWDTAIELLRQVGQVHAIVLVMRPGRFTKSDRDVVSSLRDSFGPSFWQNLCVFYTGGTAKPEQFDVYQEMPKIRRKMSEIEQSHGGHPDGLGAIQELEVYAADLNPILSCDETRNHEFRMKRALKGLGLQDLISLDTKIPRNVMHLSDAQLEHLTKDEAIEKWIDGNYFQLGLSRLHAFKQNVMKVKPYSIGDLNRMAEGTEEVVEHSVSEASDSGSPLTLLHDLSSDRSTSSSTPSDSSTPSPIPTPSVQSAQKAPPRAADIHAALARCGHSTRPSVMRMDRGAMLELSPASGPFSVKLSWPMRSGVGVDVSMRAIYSHVDGSVRDLGVGCGACRVNDIKQDGRQVLLDLASVPAGVNQICIVANIHTPVSLDWSLLRVPCFQISDCRGIELGACSLSRHLSDGYPGLIVGRLIRSSDYNQWSFQAIGRCVKGRVWSDSTTEIQSVFKSSPIDLFKRSVHGKKSQTASSAASTEAQSVSSCPSSGSSRGGDIVSL